MNAEVLNKKGYGESSKIEYPIISMAVILLLIYLSPFISLYLNYLAFGICIYRVIRYEESVFAVDYCVLASVSYIFLSTGRVSLLAWLSIAAAVWWVIQKGVKGNLSFLLLLVLLDYMLLRMQTAVNTFVLCFSQLILMYVLICNQKKQGIVKCIKAFCASVLISSVYAMVFRNSSQIRSLLGEEIEAYWRSSFTRFQGLFRDPNYYMTMVAIAIALLAVLYLNKYLTQKVFLAGTGCLLFFGSLTYSKTFLIVLMFSAALFVAMLFYRKRYFFGIGCILLILAAAVILSRTIFSVTIYRITSTNNLYDLTTGRSQLLVEYLHEITKDAGRFFFGAGLSADILERGTHNLFLEIIYYLGIVGFGIMTAYVLSLIRLTRQRFGEEKVKRNGVLRYAVLLVFLLLFSTLQGLIFAITYVMLYLSILVTVIPPSEEKGVSECSAGGGEQ